MSGTVVTGIPNVVKDSIIEVKEVYSFLVKTFGRLSVGCI